MSSFKLGLLVCLWCVLLLECRHSKDSSVPRSQWTLCWLRLCSGGGPGDCELRPGRAQLWGVWAEQRQGGELQAAGDSSASVSVVWYHYHDVTNVTQVVAGIIYSFDLVTSGGCWAGHEASTCSMSVFSQPWTQTLQVNWDSSTCDQPE